MSSSARIVPAQLSFLAIYNPSLGNTDDTAYDQILYCFERASHGKKRTQRRFQPDAKSQSQNTNGKSSKDKIEIGDGSADGEDEEEAKNKRLRRVGLARGMVEFANNFSNDVPVDSVETEKSRIVLQELEPGWWILSEVDLTKLPIAATRSVSHGRNKHTTTGGTGVVTEEVEYSSREVSPPQLLLQQLQQANAMFLLHHAPSLDALFKKVGREVFSGLLAKFWDRFARQWDVLLHGNPAIDIYNCTKLASGGELGIGVGEEEWGSGEREVLEGFLGRTQGLVDLVVGRYGDGPDAENNLSQDQALASPTIGPNDTEQRHQRDANTWLGNDEDARASDGVVFSGVGTISRKSLATVSQWMEAIFKHGENAYGVGDNPSSRPRRRRRRGVNRKPAFGDGDDRPRSRSPQEEEAHPQVQPQRGRAPDLRRKAIENSATPPGIPAPLVGQVEHSLEQAVAKAQSRESSRSPREEKTQPEAMQKSATEAKDQPAPLFTSDKMMKYLTLGYGSSWTLNPNGFSSDTDTKDGKNSKMVFTARTDQESELEGADSTNLEELDPTPEASEDEDAPFVQHLEQSIGRFLIGLSGDLENAEFEPDADEERNMSSNTENPQRIFLRTINVEMAKPYARRPSTLSQHSHSYRTRMDSTSTTNTIDANDPNPSSVGKTSASASVDGAEPYAAHQKLRVVVYVHQPFIFTFLFHLQTPNLTIPGFYRSIHHQLGPLQKPLLRSTDPERVLERISELIRDKTNSSRELTVKSNSLASLHQQTIYDLVYDPAKVTIRTSLPNIPTPGTFAAEGLSSSPLSNRTVSGSWYTLGIPIGSGFTSNPSSGTSTPTQRGLVKSNWTRLEALNVHTQMLNTWAAVRGNAHGEIERTVKTSRGWWVLWMQIHTSEDSHPIRQADGETENKDVKECFLVRKAVTESDIGPGREGKESAGSTGRWLLREQSKDSTGSASAPSSNTKGVVEGVGVDAKKWVEGLLRLSQ